MNRNKLSLRLFLSLIFMSIFFADAQVKNKMTHAFFFDSTAILINNNYIGNTDNIKYQPYDIRIPFQEFHYNIYSSRLNIGVYNLSQLIQNGGLILAGSFRDTIKEDAPFFNIDSLEYRIQKNNTVIVNYTSLSAGKLSVDTLDRLNHGHLERRYYRKGLLLYDDYLKDNDSVTVSIRTKSGMKLVALHFKKLSASETAPFLMGSMDIHNKNFPLEKFVRSALENYQKFDNKEFYNDWPSQSDNSNTLLSTDTKTAYYFRPRKDAANDSAFEYRILIGNNENANWKKSDNIIFVANLTSGTQYRLQVRYTDKPQYIYTKKFHTPQDWYQTLWFKIIVVLFLLLVILSCIFYLKNKKEKRIKQAQKNRINTIYAQLNPHFIFNALGSIQGLLNEGQIEEANIYLSGFGKLLRNTFVSGEKSSIPLYDEMQNLNSYVTLEQLRQPFKYDVIIDKTIHPKETEMLPLLFQPIIENAIKHGFKNNEQELNITFSIKTEIDNLIISVQDNGKGFDTTYRHKGNGLRLVEERIALFNSNSKYKKIKPELKSNSSGTLFILKFINWLKND